MHEQPPYPRDEDPCFPDTKRCDRRPENCLVELRSFNRAGVLAGELIATLGQPGALLAPISRVINNARHHDVEDDDHRQAQGDPEMLPGVCFFLCQAGFLALQGRQTSSTH